MPKLLFLLILIPVCGLASDTTVVKKSDSIRVSAEAYALVSEKPYSPFWINSNRNGDFSETSASHALAKADFSWRKNVAKKIALSTGIGALSDLSSYHQLQQAYAEISFRSFYLVAGRKINTGYNQPATSSGMLGISNNALPIPKVGFYMSDYENIPFTKGFAQFKAGFLHGWLGENETYIKDAYLHEKSLFIKFGANKPVDITIGLQHFAEWGGTDPVTNKELPQDIKAFWQVVRVKFKPSGTNASFINEYLNRIGNHVGTWNFGLNYKQPNYIFSAFYNMPFEDGSGSKFWQNKDFLAGIQLRMKNASIIKEVSVELLSTLWQSGPGLPDTVFGENHGYRYGGRDDYYNNYLYKEGWTYNGRVLGTPLFITRQKALLWGVPLSKFDSNQTVVNNRVRALHIGIKGSFKNYFGYRVLATFTKNYGTYFALYEGRWKGIFTNPDFDYTFNPPLNQNYFLFEINKDITNRWNLIFSGGLDTGEMTNNFGMIIGTRYNFLNGKN
ncbi:MAG TPA: capsule assembly Wzi family protein [Chitinophagaceae bacterium]